LHKTPGAFWTDCTRMKVRFLLDYQKHEVGVDRKPRRVRSNQTIDCDVSGRPAMRFPVFAWRCECVGYAFNSADTFFGQEARYSVAVVPCAISNFSDFVNTQTSAVDEVNPGRHDGSGFWRNCFRGWLTGRCDFLVPVFDRADWAIQAL